MNWHASREFLHICGRVFFHLQQLINLAISDTGEIAYGGKLCANRKTDASIPYQMFRQAFSARATFDTKLICSEVSSAEFL